MIGSPRCDWLSVFFKSCEEYWNMNGLRRFYKKLMGILLLQMAWQHCDDLVQLCLVRISDTLHHVGVRHGMSEIIHGAKDKQVHSTEVYEQKRSTGGIGNHCHSGVEDNTIGG